MKNHYPTQLDEIDQWLVDNFDIIPGACSSTENLRYNTARMIAEALWPGNVEEDLEKASHEYECTKSPYGKEAFKAGAKWQKSKDSLHFSELCKENGKSFTEETYSKKENGNSKISNDLEEAAKENAKAISTGWIKTICIENFISGANWQKEQDHDACHQCEKDYDIVFYRGMQHAFETMKEEATEATVYEDAGGYPFVPAIEMYDYEKDEPTAKKGDKVKIIILKDE